MKIHKLTIGILAFILVFAVFALAENETEVMPMHEPGTGIDNPELRDEMKEARMADMPDIMPTMAGQGPREGYGPQDAENLRKMIQTRSQKSDGNATGQGSKQMKMQQEQNQVRNAVHAFLAMENMTEGIGPRVAEVAKEYQGRFEEVVDAEEKIQSRGGFARFFMGGDYESAAAIEEKNAMMQEHINQIKSEIESCGEDCSEEIKTLLQEQIQVMEQNHERMQELAESEKSKTGLFGWMRSRE